MSKHAAAPQPSNKRNARTLAAASFGVAALALTGAGVYAALTAEALNTSAQTVTSGTLSLTMAAETGAASISTTVSDLAPGDISNKFIVLTNGGTLAGKSLGLAVTGTGGTVLTTSATKGLSVSVSRCSGPYIPATGFCSANVLTPLVAGTESTYLAKSSVSTLGTRAAFAGPINPAAGATYNLKVAVHMDATETVTNGALPGGTAQGLSTNLTYTFSEDQRDAVTTNS
jgi:hypothetical protein